MEEGVEEGVQEGARPLHLLHPEQMQLAQLRLRRILRTCLPFALAATTLDTTNLGFYQRRGRLKGGVHLGV